MNTREFSAFVVSEDDQGRFRSAITRRRMEALPPGEVLIQVAYSSLNYKDALSASGNKGVTKTYPHTPGIDASGVVVHSTVKEWRVGDQVICTGYDLGMNTAGGFGQYIRVPASWVVRLPKNLSLLEAMQWGTAGFTAGLCVWGLRQHAVFPEKGPVLVTGATGGVGSIAILLLHHLGYEVVAVTGKRDQAGYLSSLGASRIVDREQILAEQKKMLLPGTWAGVVDTVGGPLLATAIKATDFDGVVTSCGNAASADLPLNVYPFILRGVHLLGIYSANCPMPKRLNIWEQIAGSWKIPEMGRICRRIGPPQLEEEIQAMLEGRSTGRCVIEMGEQA